MATEIALPIAAATLREVLTAITRRFTEVGLDSPALDARLLVAAAVRIDQTTMLRDPDRPLESAEIDRISGYADRRLRREPVSRIIGERWFHGHLFEIGPATLDPRPETETLVDGVIAIASGLVASGKAPLRILDLGTGSGAILVALLAALPTASGVGVDISADALAVARRNAVRVGVAGRAEFRLGSWLDSIDETFDLIVSNPPYIPTAVVHDLDAEVRLYDPHAALDGGDDGLTAYRSILAKAPARLAAHGWLVLEVGSDQARAVAELCDGTDRLTATREDGRWRDLSGHLRCVAAKARSPS